MVSVPAPGIRPAVCAAAPAAQLIATDSAMVDTIVFTFDEYWFYKPIDRKFRTTNSTPSAAARLPPAGRRLQKKRGFRISEPPLCVAQENARPGRPLSLYNTYLPDYIRSGTSIPNSAIPLRITRATSRASARRIARIEAFSSLRIEWSW